MADPHDPSEIPLQVREKIVKQASRNLTSEIKLIMSAGFATLMVVSFLAGKYTFLPLASALNLRPTVAWVLMCFGVAAVWAVIHALRTGPKIQLARSQKAALEHLDDVKKRAELVAKMKDRKDS